MAKINPIHVVSTSYSPAYQEACFQAWYSAGRPKSKYRIHEAINPDENDRKPSPETLLNWRTELGWDIRGDILDARAITIAEDDLVAQKVLMLKEHAARARILQEKAQEYIEEKGFDSSASAVQAIVRGAELERTSRGLSSAILKLAEMSNEELNAETVKMLERLSESGDIIDVAELPATKEDDEEEVDEDAISEIE